MIPDELWRLGSLPSPAPLAAAYVPMQTSADPRYESDRALSRGTLFPGLDLPFMKVVNQDLEQTPMNEMMAIDFVADELELYLDTHAEDREAFALYQTILAMQKEARERFARMCGPVCQTDQLGMDRYAWLDAPWPWEYVKREG
jgi:spore coat protein JB